MRTMESTTQLIASYVYPAADVYWAWDLEPTEVYNAGDVLKFELTVGNDEPTDIHFYWMGALFQILPDGMVGAQIPNSLFGLWHPEGLGYLVNDPDVVDLFWTQAGVWFTQDVRVSFTRSNVFLGLYMYKTSPESPTVYDEVYHAEVVKLIPGAPNGDGDGDGNGNGGGIGDLSGIMEPIMMIMIISMMMGMVRQ